MTADTDHDPSQLPMTAHEPARRSGSIVLVLLVAGEHDIPIVENVPLARALYATVEVDQEIPVEHYHAVAEVIGYVMGLKRGLSGRPA